MTALARRVSAPLLEGYDYSGLSPEVAAEARAVAERVRASHPRTVIAILDMGRDLLAVKARLGHGRFGLWLEAEFGGVARTAQNYMRAAQSFADKSELVSHLPPATVYALAAPSTPGELRRQIVERLRAGERMHPDAISDAVRMARQQLREARGTAAKAPSARARSAVAESVEHVIAVSSIVQILRLSLGEHREEFVELLRDCDPNWTVADLAARL